MCKASRRAVLGLAAAGSADMMLGTASAYAQEKEGERTPTREPLPEKHHDVTKVRPEDLLPPRFSTKAACGSTVHPHGEIGGQRTYYEPTARLTSFSYNSTFYGRLETWLTFYFANTPAPWARPGQVWTYGAYVNRNDGCTSYHNLGRAVDLSRIYATNPTTHTLHKVFNARYDQWRKLTGAALVTTRRRYWATSASLHYHFQHVLTYLYNAAHHNHIHADNAVTGGGNSRLSTSSRTQVQHVQACLTYVWGRKVAVDGLWGPQTAGAASAVLKRIGRTGSVTNQANWLAFNRATLRFGSGAQRY